MVSDEKVAKGELPAVAMTVAGSDSGGGAGVQADLKTFTAYGVFGTSALTAITAQNTVGVQAVENVSPAMVVQQIDSVIDDIGCQAVKTGMLATPETVAAVAAALRRHEVDNLVVDPVMVAQSGDSLMAGEATEVMKTELFPLAGVVTPNVTEAAALTDVSLAELEDGTGYEKALREAARQILGLGCKTVVVKGGHVPGTEEAVDVFYDGEDMVSLRARRVMTENTHGSGCTFSSAIAAGLALGFDVREAVEKAKTFITKAIEHSFPLGAGRGPTNHLIAWNPRQTEGEGR